MVCVLKGSKRVPGAAFLLARSDRKVCAASKASYNQQRTLLFVIHMEAEDAHSCMVLVL